jgi:tRNA(fMet)-specific endonuclease VapC
MILDTNALSAYLDNSAEAVAVISKARSLAIPVIVAGEFAFGVSQSRHREQYEKSLQGMLQMCTVLDIGIETSRHYAAIRLELKQAGTPIPANDAWIAALSRQHSLPVMTRDTHFDLVSGLTRHAW